VESKSVVELAREEIRNLTRYMHGGDIWSATKGYPHGRVIDFSANVNPIGPSRMVIKAIRDSLWKIPFYPDPNYVVLKEAISQYLGEVKAGNIIVGNGSTELIYLFCETFLERGDSVLIPVPTFVEYEKAAKRVGARIKYLILNPRQGFKIKSRDLADGIREMPAKIVFLCNPSNPTGMLASRNDLLEVIENASRNNVLVLVDEDFIEFVADEKKYSMISVIKNYQNLFVLRSFTKFFGLAGLRIGYGVACREIINLLSRAKGPWNVNCLAEVAAIAALKDKEHWRKTRALIETERKFLLSELCKIKGFKIFPADANFILVNIRQTGLTAPQLKERMLEHGILIRDCSSFKGLDEYYIRVAVRTREENEKLIATLKKVVGAS
jgi:threonine-phosphate decarboxylase